ncbi:MAG TPA: condensation domain-containing protein, partial [Candidatus Dormibacteraeota bacterium]
ALEAEAARFQGSLDLANGPLLRIVLFGMGEGQAPRLLLVAHHLVIDAVSWRILLEDLLTAYGQLAQGIPVGLGLKTTSFKEWSERLSAMAASEETLAALPVWRAVAERGAGGLPVDLDPGAAGPDDARSAASVRVALTEAESDALLHRAARGLRAQPHELLLAALGGALEEWTGHPATLVEVEGHGREAIFDDVDLSRTVGWFTSMHPVPLPGWAGAEPAAAVASVRDLLRDLRPHALAYGLLRHLGDGAARAALAGIAPSVSFNYIGQLDQSGAVEAGLRVAPESPGPMRPEDAPRTHPLEVVGAVGDGRFFATFGYSRSRHRPETIERLAEAFVARLRLLVAGGSEAGSTDLRADFPLAGLDEEELRDLIADLDALDLTQAGAAEGP